MEGIQVAIRWDGDNVEVSAVMPQVPCVGDEITFPQYDPDSYGDNRPEWWYTVRVTKVRWFVGRAVKYPHASILKEVFVYCDVLEINKP